MIVPRQLGLLLVLLLPALASAQRPSPVLVPVPTMIVNRDIAHAYPHSPLLVDRAGNVVISSWFRDSSITLYTPDGTSVPVGRKGLGPGETIGGWVGGWVGDSIWLYSDSTLSVFTPDHRLARKQTQVATFFYLHDNVRTETIGWTWLVALYPDGSRLVQSHPIGKTVPGSPDPSAATGGVLVRAGPEGLLRKVVAALPWNPECRTVDRAGKVYILNYCPAALYAFSPTGNRIAEAFVVHGQPGFDVVSLSALGDTIFRKHFEFPLVPMPDAMRQNYKRAIDSALSPEALQTVLLPMMRRPFETMLAGDDGTVWVDLFTADRSHRWLVLDPHGNVFGEMALPREIELQVVSRRAAWGLQQGNDFSYGIVGYRVEKR